MLPMGSILFPLIVGPLKAWFSQQGNRFIDIFLCSGPSGILGSDKKQNTAKTSARWLENSCIFH